MTIKVKVGQPSVRQNLKIIARGEKKPVIVPDSVTLGVDTVGNYIAQLYAGDGIIVSNNNIETANVTITHGDTANGATSLVNPELGFIRSTEIDQFGHVTGLTSTTFNSADFAAANNELSLADNLNIDVDSIVGTSNTVNFPGQILSGVENPVANNDVVNKAFLLQELNSLETTIKVFDDPILPTDAANKRYVDGIAQGIVVRPSAIAATTADLGGSYASGNSSIGDTLTLSPTATLNIDDVITWSLGDNIVVKDQTDAKQNGSYDIIQVGDASTDWILRRAKWQYASDDLPGSFEFVTDGTVNGQTSWVITVADAESFAVNVDDITWTQFSGVGTFTAGTGLTLNGTEFVVNESQIIETINTPNESFLINGSGAIKIPAGETADRPAPASGMLRFNTTDGRFEAYDGSQWAGLAGSVIDVDQDTKIIAESSAGSDNDQLQFYTAGSLSAQIDNDGTFKVYDRFVLPTGNTAVRFSPSIQGSIRFNTEDLIFEGYDGTAWAGLGGVVDGDQDTKITAESSPGSDEDQLQFFTNGTLAAKIDNANNAFFYGDVDITGNLTLGGNITIGDQQTDSIEVIADFTSNLVPNEDSTYNLGSSDNNWYRLWVDEIKNKDNIVKIASTGSLILPVGGTGDRPTAATGMIRYNTSTSQFEGYDGNAWAGLGGIIDGDQDTLIKAESSAGADNDELEFITGGTSQLKIGTQIVANSTITSTGDLVLDAPANSHISVSNNRIINVGTPVNANDAATKSYVDTFESVLTVNDGANTFNNIDLIQSPTLTLGRGMAVEEEQASNNAITIGVEVSGVTAGLYGNDGFSPRIAIDETGRVTFATDIPVELQANAIPDFTETVHDLVGEMFRNNTEVGIRVTHDDPNDKMDLEITADYVESFNAGYGITIDHTVETGSVANVSINTVETDARYPKLDGGANAVFTDTITATQFIDADDNSFFADPASESSFNTLKLGEGQNSTQIKFRGSEGTAYLNSDGKKIRFLNSGFGTGFEYDRATGNLDIPGGDVLAERFIDTDDQTYMIHPGGSGSKIKSIEITETATVGNITLTANQLTSNTGIISLATNKIADLGTPTDANDAANKSYVDSVVQGVVVRPSVLAATVGDLGGTYNSNDGTITLSANTTLDIDGVVDWVLGETLLVKDQSNALQNGAYEVSTVGDASTDWVFTRTVYSNDSAEIPGSFHFVTDGDTYRNTGWVATVIDAESFVIGVGDIVWTQFSGSGTFTAGVGLTLTGTEFSITNPQITIAGESGANQDITLGGTLEFEGTDGVNTTISAGKVSIAVDEIDGGTF